MAQANPIGKYSMVVVFVVFIIIMALVFKKDKSNVEGQLAAETAPVSALPENESSTDIEAVELGTEGDTTNDTIRTLMATVDSLNAKIDERDTEDADNKKSVELENQLHETNIKASKMEDKYKKVLQDIANLSENMKTLKSAAKTAPPSFTKENEYPIGNRQNSANNLPRLSLPNRNNNQRTSIYTSPSNNINTDSNIVWIEPIDAQKEMNQDGTFSIKIPEISLSGNSITSNIAESDYGQTVGLSDKEKQYIPFATFAKGGTSIDGVALTALIGRIPLGGQIFEPYRFKVLLSGENLASNGIYVEGVESAIVGGKASGDYALTCVNGTIDYVTFTFEDGTISTYPDSKSSEESINLGYISDNAGVPCISGTFLSNGSTYLAQQVGIKSLEVGSKAYATAQTTTTTSGENVNSGVTGDAGKYALGEMGAAGLETASDWLSERQQSAFDAVYAPPATRVTLHFEHEIPINYNLKGRRTNHDQYNQAMYNSADYSGMY